MVGTAKSGRKPKASGELKSTGGYRADRHGDRLDANSPPPGKPKKPTGLGKYGRKVWDDVTGGLPETVLGSIDTTMLGELCRWYQDYRDAETLNDRCKAWDRFRVIAVEYGMTPAARAAMKVPVEPDNEESGIAQLLGRLQGRN